MFKRNFGWISNPRNGKRGDLIVSIIDADMSNKLEIVGGCILIAIGIRVLSTGLFNGGASAYNNAEDKLFTKLELFED